MQFWISAAVLLAVVTAALPLGTWWLAKRLPEEGSEGGLSVLKHQFDELTSDIAAGRVSSEEADGLRNELSRRILAESRGKNLVVGRHVSQRFMVLTLLVPMLAVLVYLQIGKPNLPDVPRAERLANAQKNGDTEALVAQVEDHLAKKPDDVQGWQLLVPFYMDSGRFGDAAGALMQIMALKGESAELKAGVAEALTLRDQGLMPELAITAATDAFRLDAKNPKGQFYHALALSQLGKKPESLAAFRDMLASSPADAPWRKSVNDQIARLTMAGSAPAISEDQAVAVKNLAPADQKAMIHSMVDGLDAKLAANGDDLEGWLRLIRARVVLGESDKANAALAKARGLFVSKPDALTAINNLAKELKLT